LRYACGILHLVRFAKDDVFVTVETEVVKLGPLRNL